ncbi:hypothetical protein SCUP515_13100 [Seiridium cupressi]
MIAKLHQILPRKCCHSNDKRAAADSLLSALCPVSFDIRGFRAKFPDAVMNLLAMSLVRDPPGVDPPRRSTVPPVKGPWELDLAVPCMRAASHSSVPSPSSGEI